MGLWIDLITVAPLLHSPCLFSASQSLCILPQIVLLLRKGRAARRRPPRSLKSVLFQLRAGRVWRYRRSAPRLSATVMEDILLEREASLERYALSSAPPGATKSSTN